MNIIRIVILYPIYLIVALFIDAKRSFYDQPFMINRRRRKIRKMIARHKLENDKTVV